MVCVIVVDYKSMDKTLKYIKNLKENLMNVSLINTVIIDNFPESNAQEALKQQMELEDTFCIDDKEVLLFKTNGGTLCYCKNSENAGYAKGNNLGIRINNEIFRDEFMIISNNDLEFIKPINWADIQVIFEEHDDIAVVGPQIITPSGKRQSPNRKISAYYALIHQYLFDFKPFKLKGDIDYTGDSKYCYRVSGCFMIVRTRDMLLVDGFDEHTFLYCEEMILSERLARVNKKMYFLNSIALLHNHGSTTKKNQNIMKARDWTYESYIYYFITYRNVKKYIIRISEVCHRTYVIRSSFRGKIKSLLKYEQR